MQHQAAGSLTAMNLYSEDLLTEKNNGCSWTRTRGNSRKPSRRTSFAQRLRLRATANRWDAGQVTIDLLPDDVLLEILAFYMEETSFYSIDTWHTLVHVNRKWRIVVFGSPRRLKLRLQCGTARKRSRQTLDIWPALPIVLWQHDHLAWDTNSDNIMAALEHHNRVCEIKLWDASSSQLEKVLAVVKDPFPALTSVLLRSRSEIAHAISNSFLSGSAPRLQELTFDGIAFPGLPKLLSSSAHLVELELWRIPHSGYISPEAMVSCLSTLTRLERLCLKFQSPHSSPQSRRPAPHSRSVLPALTYFRFKGVSEYLEDFVARIDAPMLDKLDITFFHQLIFDTPNLPQFVSRSPNLKGHDEACVAVSDSGVRIAPVRPFVRGFPVDLEISCRQSGWQLSSLAQVCRSTFPHTFICSLETLYIREDEYHGNLQVHWQDDAENSQWLELLHPFTAVKNLYLSKEFTPRIASVLQELVGERVEETLPALRGLFLEDVELSGPVQDAIGQFVAARQLSGHPIAVSHWGKDQDEWLKVDSG